MLLIIPCLFNAIINNICNQNIHLIFRNNVCEIFNHSDEEIKKLTIDLAKEMIIPNYNKKIINGGLIELFSTDSSEESNIENSFKNFIHLLEISTKEVAYLFETS